jgi:flavin reductase (DIM6/NTAB) family NADH-FMN oxidoreductase RutF
MRMQFNPHHLDEHMTYKLLAGSVVPRPIAWVTTVNAAGTPNAAPYSFFNVMASAPPLLGFAVSSKGGRKKDTLANIEAVGEFVVNIVPSSLAVPMNQTAAEYPPGANELDKVQMGTAPSVSVRPPRIAASPIHLECRLREVLDFQANYVWVVGEVVMFHVADDLLLDKQRIDLHQLSPLGRLIGNSYTRNGEIFELFRDPPDA